MYYLIQNKQIKDRNLVKMHIIQIESQNQTINSKKLGIFKSYFSSLKNWVTIQRKTWKTCLKRLILRSTMPVVAWMLKNYKDIGLNTEACSKKPIPNGLNQSGQRAKRVGSKNQNPETWVNWQAVKKVASCLS